MEEEYLLWYCVIWSPLPTALLPHPIPPPRAVGPVPQPRRGGVARQTVIGRSRPGASAVAPGAQ
eukprot:4074325-Pyramimonas_sp.AAC.1